MRPLISGERPEDWRCCFCCHVRTGTIFLGVWNLLLNTLAVAIMLFALMNPQLLCNDPNQIGENSIFTRSGSLFEPTWTVVNGSDDAVAPADENADLNFFMRKYAVQKMNLHDVHLGLAITICTFIICAMLVYGAVKGRPGYLIPFFCLQILDFCFSCLTMIGYLSYMPDIKAMVQTRNGHVEDENSAHWVSVLLPLGLLIMMVMKAYLIGVVWSCYRYLNYRLTALQSPCIENNVGHIYTGSQFDFNSSMELLPPPDYDTVTKDAKNVILLPPTSGHSDEAPPPPYYAAAAGDDGKHQKA